MAMASRIRPETKPDGAILELIARGEKDKYFLKDDIASENPFDWRYGRFPATIPEVRRTVPLNAPSFGGKVEWELDLPGDILVEANIRIDLPSWIPPAFLEYNKRGAVQTTNGPEPIRYGYVNGIGYFLFKKIELLQDNIVIQECTGDSLYLTERNRGSWNGGFLQDTLRGIHTGTAVEIQRNATPDTLCLQVPIPGTYPTEGSKGFPICCVRKQSYRLRAHLRSLEELVEASDGSAKPAPWGKEFVAMTNSLPTKVFTAFPLEKIPKPVLTLETKQLYLKNTDRATLEQETIDIPFIRFFDNPLSINGLDYASIRTGLVLTPTFLTRFIDANYTVEQILVAFRGETAVRANQLWNLQNSESPDFYSELQLVIAGQVREGPWDGDFWKRISPHANGERSIQPNISYISWGLGYQSQGQSPAFREPSGGVNFTTADRPMLSFVPTDVPAVDGAKNTQILCVAESWALYRIEKGRAYLAYAN